MKLITALALGMVPFSANAAITVGDIIGIDFQPTDARAGSTLPVGTNFNVFNSEFTDGTATTVAIPGTLINTTGSAVSGVGFSVTNNTTLDSIRATFSDQGSIGSEVPGSPLAEQAVWDDALIVNSQSGANATQPSDHFLFTFSGLDDSLSYNLEGGFDNLAGGGGNSNFDAIWTADGQSFTTTPQNGTGYGTLTGLQTDGSGNLVIEVKRNTLHITVAGLTLEAAEAIPEPSSAALLGLGGLALILRRRK